MRPETSIQNISQYSLKGTEVRVNNTTKPDPEVPEKRPRRRFNAQYKIRILDEVAGSSDQGYVGAILRREGLYLMWSSKKRHLVKRPKTDYV